MTYPVTLRIYVGDHHVGTVVEDERYGLWRSVYVGRGVTEAQLAEHEGWSVAVDYVLNTVAQHYPADESPANSIKTSTLTGLKRGDWRTS